MSINNVKNIKNPSQKLVSDILSEFLRESAQKMLKIAIEDEVENFISEHAHKKLQSGQKQIVRNGYLPERVIQTGIGEIEVQVPRIRDRCKDGIRFTSSFIPPYMRRTVTLDVLLPLLYLKGISTKDFADSFEPILGSKPKNMSPNVICRLKEHWSEQYTEWQKRDLSNKNYVYFWVDGVYLQARREVVPKNWTG